MRKLTIFALVLVFLALPVKNSFAADSAIPLTFSGYVVTEGTANFGDKCGDNANNFYTTFKLVHVLNLRGCPGAPAYHWIDITLVNASSTIHR